MFAPLSRPFPRAIRRAPGVQQSPMPPPSIVPANAFIPVPEIAGSTDESFWTAPTQPANPEGSGTQEETASSSQDPFDNLWGRLVPCNPLADAYDLSYDKPTVTIGRNPNSDLVLLAAKISGRHCEIQLLHDPDGQPSVNVLDLSSNGTFINGTKLGKGRNQRLAHGDEICLGLPLSSLDNDDFRFIFRRSTAAITSGGGIHSQYQLGDILGSGSFAVVRKAYSKVTGETFACKIITKSRFAGNDKAKEMFERELSILQSLRHHNITRLIEYFEDESTIFIVLEFVGGGDLLDFIQHHGPIREDVVKSWAAQMIDGMAYSHNKGITHRDLKPENVLLTSEQTPRIKVADFGLAKQVIGNSYLKTMCGTPQYLAPEVVLGNNSMPGYDNKVDCYSIGVIIWAMLTNVTCFPPEDESRPLAERMLARRVNWSILTGKHVSAACLDFLRAMITSRAVDRMSLAQARQHPWIRDVPNTPPADFVGSQSQSQSQARSSQSSDHSMASGGRAGTEELPGDALIATSTDPYDFADDAASKGMDGMNRWEFAQGGRRLEQEPSDEEFSSGSNLISDARLHQGPGHQQQQRPVVAHDSSLSPAHEDEFSQDLSELAIDSNAEERTHVGTPPGRKSGMMDMELDGDSWEHVDVGRPTRRYNNPPATHVMQNGDTRVVKAPPKPRRNTVLPPIITTNHASNTIRTAAGPAQTSAGNTPKTRLYELGVGAASTTKRKAQDVDFDGNLSSATPSPSEGEDITDVAIASRKRRELANNRSFDTSSSNSTVRGKSRKVSSEESNGAVKATRQSAGGGGPVGTAGARASIRIRDRQSATPGLALRRSTGAPTEKRRVPGRFKAPSGSSSEDEDDEDEEHSVETKAGPSSRKAPAPAAPAPTPMTNGTRRNTRTVANKTARLR